MLKILNKAESSPPLIPNVTGPPSGSTTLSAATILTFSSTETWDVKPTNSGASGTSVTVIWTSCVVLLKPSSAKTVTVYTLSASESDGLS